MKKNIIIEKNYDIQIKSTYKSRFNKTYLRALTDPYLVVFDTIHFLLPTSFPNINWKRDFEMQISQHEFVYKDIVQYYVNFIKLNVFQPLVRESTVTFYTSRFMWIEAIAYYDFLHELQLKYRVHVLDTSTDPSINNYLNNFLTKIVDKYQIDLQIIRSLSQSDSDEPTNLVIIEVLKQNKDYAGYLNYYYLQPFILFVKALRTLNHHGNCYMSFRVQQPNLLYQFAMLGKRFFRKVEFKDFEEKYIPYVNLIFIDYEYRIGESDLNMLFDIINDWEIISPNGETTLNYSDKKMNEEYSSKEFMNDTDTDKFVVGILDFDIVDNELYDQIYYSFNNFKDKLAYLKVLYGILDQILDVDKEIILYDILTRQKNLFIAEIVKKLLDSDVKVTLGAMKIYQDFVRGNIDSNPSLPIGGFAKDLLYLGKLLQVLNISIDMRGNMSLGNVKILRMANRTDTKFGVEFYINAKFNSNISAGFVLILNILNQYQIKFSNNIQILGYGNASEFVKGINYYFKLKTKSKVINKFPITKEIDEKKMTQYVKNSELVDAIPYADIFVSGLDILPNSKFVFLSKFDMQGVSINKYDNIEDNYAEQNLQSIIYALKVIKIGGIGIFELGGIITLDKSVKFIKMVKENFDQVYFYGSLRRGIFVVGIDRLADTISIGESFNDELVENMKKYTDDYINQTIRVFGFLSINGLFEMYSNEIAFDKIKYAESWNKLILNNYLDPNFLI